METRAAALALLRSGAARPAELAALAGVPVENIASWVNNADIDWRKARNGRLATLWRKELQRGPRLVEEEARRGRKPSSVG